MKSDVIQINVRYTNQHINNCDKNTNSVGILVRIGILIMMGVSHDSKQNISDLWPEINSGPFYKAITTHDIISELVTHL